MEGHRQHLERRDKRSEIDADASVGKTERHRLLRWNWDGADDDVEEEE